MPSSILKCLYILFCALITQKTSKMERRHSEAKFMDLVQQILQISAWLEKKTWVSHTLLAEKTIKISKTPRRNLLIDVKGKKAAETKSSEVGKNMFLRQRGMVELSWGQNREQLGNTRRTTTKEDFSIKLLFITSLNTGLPTKPRNPVQSVHDYTHLCTKLRIMASNDLHFLRKYFKFKLSKNGS